MKHILLFIILFLTVTKPVFTQAGTPKANPSTSPSSSPSGQIDADLVKEKLKERLEKTLAENPIPKRVRWYGMFGIITAKTGEDTLSLTKIDNSTATIVVTPETSLNFYKSGAPTRKIKMADIQQDWFAIAMGTEMAENQTLTAARVTFSAKPAPMPKRTIVFGKVTEIDDSNITLTNGKTSTITIPKKYSITISGVSKAEINDVNINDKAVAIVEELADGNNITNSLKSLYVIPSSNNPKAAGNQIKEATSAGQATPSASVKASPKTTPKN